MEIHWVEKDKKRYLPLLLLGDEQESMIDRYLARGEMYVIGTAVLLQSVWSRTKETVCWKSKIWQ